MGRSPPFTLFWLPCGVQRANVAGLGGKHRFSVLRQTALSLHSVANYRHLWFFAEPVALIGLSQSRHLSFTLRFQTDSPRPRSASRPSALLREPPVDWPFDGRLAPFGFLRIRSVDPQPKLILFRLGCLAAPFRKSPPTEVDFSLGVGLLAKSVKRSVIRGRFPFSAWLIAEHMDMLGHRSPQR